MRIALCFLSLLLLANYAHICESSATQIIAEQPTEQEAREAREVAAAFLSRIQKTRDIAALKDLYVDDSIRRRMGAEQISLSDFGSSLFYRAGLKAEADPREWERFYAAQTNLNYFMVLYYLATGEEIFTHEPTNSELCPPEALALLNANPFLVEKSPDKKYKIESLEEFRGVLATLERAAALMRERFAESPPEQTERYRENVRAWAVKEPEEPVYIQTGDWPGFAEGTRLFRLRTSPQLFDLTLVRTHEGMKLVWAKVYPFD
ncbi:MAG TPA: hypothetical protein VF544_21220 [Pyrinomonadaceae bacterium]|jgi:hypothetical protein